MFIEYVGPGNKIKTEGVKHRYDFVPNVFWGGRKVVDVDPRDVPALLRFPDFKPALPQRRGWLTIPISVVKRELRREFGIRVPRGSSQQDIRMLYNDCRTRRNLQEQGIVLLPLTKEQLLEVAKYLGVEIPKDAKKKEIRDLLAQEMKERNINPLA